MRLVTFQEPVFSTVQGEGALVGTPSTFVRLWGCDFSCSWCFVPETRVLMADWSWKTLNNVEVGDEVMAQARDSAHMTKATVTRLSRDYKHTVRVNGFMRCTPDHKFWKVRQQVDSITHDGWTEIHRLENKLVRYLSEPPPYEQDDCQPKKQSSVVNTFDKYSAHSKFIESVKPTGLLEEVVTVTTTEGSFVAEGFLVKNCDTKESWRAGSGWVECDAASIAEQVLRYENRYVVITGGNPVLQGQELLGLVQDLRTHGLHVTLETQGSIYHRVLRHVNLLSLSPKLHAWNWDVLRVILREGREVDQAVQFKVVVTSDEEVLAAISYLCVLNDLAVMYGYRAENVYCFLQPESSRGRVWVREVVQHLQTSLRAGVPPMRDCNIRVLPQVHKYLGII